MDKKSFIFNLKDTRMYSNITVIAESMDAAKTSVLKQYENKGPSESWMESLGIEINGCEIPQIEVPTK